MNHLSHRRHAMRAARGLAVPASLLAALAACDTPTDADPRTGTVGIPGEVASVEVIPDRATIRIGDTTQLAVQLRDYAGGEATGTVTWRTVGFGAVTVSQTGLIVGITPGQARVVATSNGKADTAVVDVPHIPIATIDVVATDSSFLEDRSTQVVATARDAAGATLRGKHLAWNSSDPSVAVVSSKGVVTGRGPGIVTISAVGENVVGTARLTLQPIFTSVVSGSEHACATSQSGIAFCWGRNDQGQLGDGTTTSRSMITRVATQTRFKGVFASGAHTCAVSESDRLYCWGANGAGQLGDGTQSSRGVPTLIPGLWSIGYVRLGPSQTCALNRGGSTAPGVYCWGDNTSGQFGTNDRSLHLVPTFHSVYAGPSPQAFGSAHTCSMYACWGNNAFGQLGDGTTISRDTPAFIVQAPAFDTLFNDLAAGPFTTCAARNGLVWCWGRMPDGSIAMLPQEIRAGLNLGLVVGVGERHGCTLSFPGRDMYCWGRNDHGQVGDGTSIDRAEATLVGGGLYVKSFMAGLNHTCALTQANNIVCWGRNDHGQLGDGSTTSRTTPQMVLFR